VRIRKILTLSFLSVIFIGL